MGPLTRIEELFIDALQRPDHSRQTFLEQHCSDNPALRASVESLLRVHTSDGPSVLSRLEPFSIPPEVVRLAVSADSAPVVDYPPGAVIDSYLLLRHLGSGGMGIVYLAKEQAPITRLVALKLLKRCTDQPTEQQMTVERQTLALLQHPCIPRIFSAGTTPDGRSYLAMEYINGTSITEFCIEQRLAIPQRVDLFTHLCDAVRHAHRNGIVHRDIKPSNVLIVTEDGVPSPRLIDFGIDHTAEVRN